MKPPDTSRAAEISGETNLAPEWVSYEVGALLTGLSRATLWRRAAAGELKVAKIGRAARISRASLDSLMERRASHEQPET
jgi:excisionase family DNA binding protein